MPDNSPENVFSRAASEGPHPRAKSLSWWFARFASVTLFFGTGLMLIVLLGVAQRTGWIRGGSFTSAATSTSGSQEIYTCPMHPQIRQPGEGRCPICGMALVPATSSGEDLDELAVRIEPAQRRLANITTAEVMEHPVSTTIRTIGAIQIDESRQATIASYIEGRVERLFADYTGVQVEKGDHLAVVYSPQLYSAQVEYVESKRTLESGSGAALASVREAQTRLVANSRQRLVELGMTEEQLAELETSGEPRSRLTIFAPIGGTVIEKLAEEGKYISAGEPVYRIANLSTVWLMLELYPEDASRIRFGQIVEAELTSMPGKTLIGRVAFIDPRVNESSRTVGVRVEFNNAEGDLRPGDYARAGIAIPIGPQGEVYDQALAGKWISPMHPQVIRDEPGDCPICGMKLVPTTRYGYIDHPVAQPASIVVPRSAVLMAGDHSVVYVETEPGRFELRSITLGAILRDEAIVLDGVKPGEYVATAGNFLIDSQMQLAGKPSLIDPDKRMKAEGGGIKNEHRNTPLKFTAIHVVRIGGVAGEHLEKLYQAYSEIQKTLSRDQKPTETAATSLTQLSGELTLNESLGEEIRKQLATINANSAHLQHLSIEDARKKFKSISHAVITLATEVRGQSANTAFKHFFCPMVKQGEGDWLQVDDQLSNPYFGSEMLHCGELVRTIGLKDEGGEMRDE
jgi:membrane fusion protein, copper/silver efflux system